MAGAWRGRSLVAPAGQTTRPTADRVRQALFDMLMHAPWGGRAVVDGASVLDGFAGTGALGLEALSRGASRACFIESDPLALKALRGNISACKADDKSEVLAADILRIGPGAAATLVFLDPPYGEGLVPRALGHLRQVGRVGEGTLVVAEIGREEIWREEVGRSKGRRPEADVLAERVHGAARVVVFRV